MTYMEKLHVLTVLLLAITLEAFSQKTVLIEDQTYHCFTQPQTEFWVINHDENQERKEIIIDIKKNRDSLEAKVELQKVVIKSQSEVIDEYRFQLAVSDSIRGIDNEIISITDEDLRKKRQNEKWSKVWNNWLKPTLIGIGSGAVGFGIGTLVR